MKIYITYRIAYGYMGSGSESFVINGIDYVEGLGSKE